MGDRLLAEVGGRLRAALRSSDLMARHGGDEFVGVLLDLDPLDAERVAARAAADLRKALSRPIPTGSQVVTLGASVGVALLGRDGHTGTDLLRAADREMYRAKSGAAALPRQGR